MTAVAERRLRNVNGICDSVFLVCRARRRPRTCSSTRCSSVDRARRGCGRDRGWWAVSIRSSRKSATLSRRRRIDRRSGRQSARGRLDLTGDSHGLMSSPLSPASCAETTGQDLLEYGLLVGAHRARGIRRCHGVGNDVNALFWQTIAQNFLIRVIVLRWRGSARASAVIDLRTRRVPNPLTLGITVSASRSRRSA